MPYSSFASFYDLLMSDCDYKARAEYLCKIFDRYDIKSGAILDMACGTGSIALELMRSGYSLCGVDPSQEMLSIADNKLSNAGFKDYELICSGAESFRCSQRFDGCVCTLDSINHITDAEKLKSAFDNIFDALLPGGVFIFDVNSEYKHKSVLADNSFVIENDDVLCTWRNNTDGDITDVYLDFFVFNGDGYDRYSEDFSERAYSDEMLLRYLKNSGFTDINIYGDLSFDAPGDREERKVFTARKV